MVPLPPTQASASPGAENAKEPPVTRGVELGVGVAGGIPYGKVDGTADYSEWTSGQIALDLDAGLRFSPATYLGTYLQFGTGFSGSQFSSCGSCSNGNLRVGLTFRLHFSPEESFDPYVGAGLGYETFSLSAGNGQASVDVKGMELVHLQMGGDYRVSRSIVVGPYLLCTLGRFTSITTSGLTTNTNGTLSDQSLHGWILVGVKGAFTIGY
jgi:hypothetical protein